jgi:hypothetical protein
MLRADLSVAVMTKMIVVGSVMTLVVVLSWNVTASALGAEFRQHILPTECVFETIDVGTGQLNYITPFECGQIIQVPIEPSVPRPDQLLEPSPISPRRFWPSHYSWQSSELTGSSLDDIPNLQNPTSTFTERDPVVIKLNDNRNYCEDVSRVTHMQIGDRYQAHYTNAGKEVKLEIVLESVSNDKLKVRFSPHGTIVIAAGQAISYDIDNDHNSDVGISIEEITNKSYIWGRVYIYGSLIAECKKDIQSSNSVIVKAAISLSIFALVLYIARPYIYSTIVSRRL